MKNVPFTTTYDIQSAIISIVLVSPLLILAQQMSSTNYKIQIDSVNVGGLYSTSSSYLLEDTAGEVGTGEGVSASYRLKAGYQQMNEVYLAITGAPDVTLSPNLSGIIANTATGSTTVTVTTDALAGYELSIKASSSPALVSGGDSFADYVPAGGNPDFTFSVPPGTAEFGFSPEGTDIVAKYKDNGSVCNTGGGDTLEACWNGLSTTNEIIARRTSSNHPSGIETKIVFRAGNGASHIQVAGTYTATSTLTLLSL